jgi:adenine-specific DNA-methyltransferase
VLKLLQKSYFGKVKMIYIDPPYNTGNDFIYPDDYTESLDTYLRYTGQIDSEGRKFSTNTEADGRFHSKWLNMMYPRLFLARNLLCEDGLIFISIDDTEVDDLKKVVNEIFGEEHFVEQIVWKNKYNSGALTKGFSNVHEYILCYSKGDIFNIQAPLSDEARAEYRGKDSKFSIRGPYVTQPLATGSKDLRPNLRFPIPWQGTEIWPDKQWLWSKERVEAALANDDIVVNETDGKLNVRVKQYLRDEHGQIRKTKPLSLMVGPYNQEGSKEIDDLLGKDIFDFPKPSALVAFLLSITVDEPTTVGGIILDFTAGSGTTAQAVFDLNRQDGGARQFILVQLPEPCDPESAAFKAGYKNVAEICKERIRRVIKKMNEEDAGKLELKDGPKQDGGFKVFKLQTSNFTAWDPEVPKEPEVLAKQLEMHVQHIASGRSEEDILFEILLKSGYALAAPIQKLELAGKVVHSIDSGLLVICLDHSLSNEVTREIAGLQPTPERVVLLDEGFAGNDQLKTNAVQTMKAKGIVFRTV